MPRALNRARGMSLFSRKKEELSLHKIKQNGRRWLSGLLALIMIAGLIPASRLTASAAGGGGGAPDSIQMQKAAFADAGSFDDPNLPSATAAYNKKALMRVFYMEVGDYVVPGFCANHDLHVNYKPHAMTWSNGESIQTAQGGKYAAGYNIFKWYVAKYMRSNYIRDTCGITEKNWKDKYPGNPKVQNYENAVQQWADENGYGWYAYSSEWTMQLDAGDRPKGRSPAKFFCQKTHRSNRSYRYFLIYKQ